MHAVDGIPSSELEEAAARTGDAWAELAGGRMLVTGGTGFLGRWLVASLIHANRTRALGLRLVCVTRSAARFRTECPDMASDPAVTLIEGDVRFFEQPPGPFTHIIHAATDTSVEANTRPLELIDTIVDGTRRVLAFARAAGARKLLYLSSGAVYGPQPPDLARVPESWHGSSPTTDPRSNYAQAKRLAEQLCTVYHHEFGIGTTIARGFAFAGAHMNFDGHFAIGNFVRDAVLGRPIRVAGDGAPTRSYLYAGDSAAWLIRILARGRPGSAYNLGSGEAVTIAALAARVAATVPGARGVVIEGRGDATGPRSSYVPDVARARAELGLEVWTGLDETIRRTARWLSLHESVRAAPEGPNRGGSR